MKKNFLTLFFSFLFLTGIFAQSDEIEAIAKQEALAHRHLIDFRDADNYDNYDIVHGRFEWEINPNVYYIKGEITYHFYPLEDNFSTINLDLTHELTVDSIIYHGVSLSFTHGDDDIVTFDLPAPLPVMEMDSFSIFYQGEPAYTGFGSFIQSVQDGTSKPIIWTLSEPFGAKDWWPTKSNLHDKIDSMDVIVTTPVGYRAASNGLLVEEGEADGKAFYHWQHRYPIESYLVAIAVTDYFVYSDYVPMNGGQLEILNYVYPHDSTYAQNNTPGTVEIMQLYNELFEDYPFAGEKYGHAQFGWGGGMEHQTMTFMGGFSFELIAHELAHQWFGDKVTCGSWSDIWLNEGFATYLTGLTMEHGMGNYTFDQWKISKINHITGQPGGSVYVTNPTSTGEIFSGRLSYSKGAMVLHMLRQKIGDEAFFQGVKNYLADPALAYSYALTDDLKQHLETTSGMDLTEFFADWFYGQGYPSYHIQWSQDEAQNVNVIFNQTTSHESVDFFEMPVPIRFSGEGKDTTVVFDNTTQGQMMSASLDFVADNAIFDPDHNIVSKNNTIEMIAVGTNDIANDRSISLYPNPVRDNLTIQLEDRNDYLQSVSIFDVAGNRIRQIACTNQKSVHFNTADLVTGIYMARVTTNTGTQTVKFTKINK